MFYLLCYESYAIILIISFYLVMHFGQTLRSKLLSPINREIFYCILNFFP